MGSSIINVEGGKWVRLLPSGRSGVIRYSYGIGEVYLTQTVNQPVLEPAQLNPIMGVLQPNDTQTFDRLILESIWCYSPEGSAAFVVTPLEVTPPIAPVIAENPEDFTIEVGTSQVLHSSAVDWDSMEWFKDGVATGVTTPHWSRVFESHEGGSEFFARYTNTAGSTDTTTCTIAFDPAYPIITTQPTGKTLNVGDTLTLVSAATGWADCTWYHNDTPRAGIPPTLVYNSVQLVDAGVYYAEYRNANNKVTRTRKVTVTVS